MAARLGADIEPAFEGLEFLHGLAPADIASNGDPG